MLTAVSGYYNGSGIIMDEPVPISIGQRVIITILEPVEPPQEKVSLRKFMGRGEKMFSEDAAEYVRGLRANDRV